MTRYEFKLKKALKLDSFEGDKAMTSRCKICYNSQENYIKDAATENKASVA